MKTWQRSRGRRKCGRCGDVIPPGDPYLEWRVTFLGTTTSRDRCSKFACAGEAIPELPPLETPKLASTMPSFTPLVHIASGPCMLPLDWKSRGAGE